MAKTHELKTVSPFFEDVEARRKNFEIRRDDRDFNIGDTLRLRHYYPDLGYSGRETTRTIIYVLRGFEGLAPGFAVLGLEP